MRIFELAGAGELYVGRSLSSYRALNYDLIKILAFMLNISKGRL
jgi:hypothetical protein